MNRLAALLVMCVALLLMGASEPYDHDADPGPNGEPGKMLRQVYSQEFRVSEDEYFAALNEFYSFARMQDFDVISFGECFSKILDVQSTKFTPCIGVYAAKGAPTKAHMTFTVVAKSYNTPRRQDYLTCRIGIYINRYYEPARAIAPEFQAQVDASLQELDRKVEASLTR